MTISTLQELAHRHCHTSKPALSIRSFVPECYGVGYQFFRDVVTQKREPSAKLLRGMAQAHARLFPSEPVTLLLPNNHPPVVLGDLTRN